jgi:hypothetical protein
MTTKINTVYLLENLGTVSSEGEIETSLDCAWILANITTKNTSVVTEVLERGMLVDLLRILEIHPQIDARIEAARAICNIAKHGKDNQVVYTTIMESTAVSDLVTFLNELAKTPQSPQNNKIIRQILLTLVLLPNTSAQIKAVGGITLYNYASSIFISFK